jgi:hypothetical protein
VRTFHLQRDEDATGVSGTGRVAEGVEFSDGTCCMHWLTEHTSWAMYEGIAVIEAIHGHDGKTRVVFDEGQGEPVAIWLEKLHVEKGDSILVRYPPDRQAAAQDLMKQMMRIPAAQRQTLMQTGPHAIIHCPADITIETISEQKMNSVGWVRLHLPQARSMG